MKVDMSVRPFPGLLGCLSLQGAGYGLPCRGGGGRGGDLPSTADGLVWMAEEGGFGRLGS